MTFTEAQWGLLAAYRSRGSEAVSGIEVRVYQEHPSKLIFQYVLRAEISRIRVPSLQAPARTDGLWKHTCFEGFVAVSGTPGYCELNFSPSRQWAMYRFNGYRAGMSVAEITMPPQLTVRSLEDRLELDAVVELRDLPGAHPGHSLRLALSAVVEDDSGTLSYWALKHAPDKPDFHHADSFVLELPL